MNGLQKVLGRLFLPYKFKVLRKENTQLLNALILSLPDEFNDLKLQRSQTNLLHISPWSMFQDFMFLTTGYPGTTLTDYKKKNINYKLAGIEIYSKQKNQYVPVELIIFHNFISGLKIVGSNYDLSEFDLNKISVTNISKENIKIPESNFDKFYNNLDESIKVFLDPDEMIEIDLDEKTYYTFYDLQDGNYLATDKNFRVYSLVHDAKPIIKQLDCTLQEMLSNINNRKFDEAVHLSNRYKT